MTRNTSRLDGLRSGRSGYELTLSVGQALRVHTVMRWVNKTPCQQIPSQNPARGMLSTNFWQVDNSGSWFAMNDSKGPKERAAPEKLSQMQNAKMAEENQWPMDHLSLRSMGDAITEQPCHISTEVIPPRFNDET